MNVALDIAQAGIAARLAGREADRMLLDRRLQAMLREAVLPRVAAQLGETVSDETILCLLDIDLHCQMTLQDVMSGAGAALWADRLASMIAAKLDQGDQVWRFHNRWDFFATYLRWRLGLVDLPGVIFAEVGSLALLSPRQAWVEALRTWPEIWRWLAPDGVTAAHRLLRTLLSQGGIVAVTEIFTAALAENAETQGAGSSESLLVELESLSQSDLAAFAPSLIPGQFSTTEAAFFVSLCLGPGLAHSPVPTGLMLAMLAKAIDAEGHGKMKPLRLFRAMRQTLVDCPAGVRTLAQSLLATLGGTRRGRAVLRDLALTLRAARSVITLDTSQRSQTDNESEQVAEQFTQTGHDDATQLRRLFSPVAGLCLLLPFLAENRIARGFPASVRLAALVLLARGGPVEQPEKDLLLRAVAGIDPAETSPSSVSNRPSGTDLLFVQADRRGAIELAPPGHTRLALWLEARFAASLPGFSTATRGFLASQFWHQSGCLQLSDEQAILELDPLPLSVVLQLGGCIGPELCRLDWLQGQMLSICIREEI